MEHPARNFLPAFDQEECFRCKDFALQEGPERPTIEEVGEAVGGGTEVHQSTEAQPGCTSRIHDMVGLQTERRS